MPHRITAAETRRKRRIACTVNDQVAIQDAILDFAVGEQKRAVAEFRSEVIQRGCGGE
jgi:hypothetical protein